MNAPTIAGSRILVVCTGNVCRSPYIERRLSTELAGSGIVVRSAGTSALTGSDLDPEIAVRLRRMSSDPDGFVARPVDMELIRTADLVLCATRGHRSRIVRLEPRALRLTFALADFADLAAAALGNGTGEVPGAAVQLWRFDSAQEGPVRRAVAVASGVRDRVQARAEEDCDLVDPFKRPASVFDAMARQVDALLPPIVHLLRRASSPIGQGHGS